MSASASFRKSVFKWLTANLGKGCLAPLTGQDSAALCAAAQIVELWCYTDDRESAALAFHHVVKSMQPHTRELAFHVTAMMADWGHRLELWQAACLPLPEVIRVCAFEPGGKGGAE